MPAWRGPRASPSQQLFGPGRAALQPALRADPLTPPDVAELAHALALSHGTPLRGARALAFFPRLRENVAVLNEAHHAIAEQERNGHHVSAAGEWLLDNMSLVLAQTREVQNGLPRRYFRGLPVLATGDSAGLPRVYALAWAYVSLADSAFDPALLVRLLVAYQTLQPLTQGELWALPTTLRVVLVENLRRLAERVATEAAAREAAHRLCDGLCGGPNWASDVPVGPGGLRVPPQALFERMGRRGALRAFALQVMERLHSDSDTGTPQGARYREAVRLALADALPAPVVAQAEQQLQHAADNRSVGRAIRSLQVLGSADWRGLVAQASPLMRTLLAWPPFAAERDATQDITLHAIERLARRSRRSEIEVATLLLGRAATPLPADATGQPPPHAALGYWLQGAGTGRFRQALGLRAGLARPQVQALSLWGLLATLGLGTLGLSEAFMHLAAAPQLPPWAWWAMAFLALWPASEAVIAVVNRLVSESVPPRGLPGLALAAGIPFEHRVLLVLPALLSSTETVAALVQRLERHHLSNLEQHAQFALLTDFGDAATQDTPADATLLAAAQTALEALEARHPRAPGLPRRFLLLHRQRRWSISEQQWIGWERKRGKLEQLVVWLAAPASRGKAPFVDLGALSTPVAGTPYILTLDADTVLPPGALRQLVGLAAHPMNQPRVDPVRRRVVAGHGILQPRIVAAWPVDGQGRNLASGFHRLFAGAAGHDPYNAVASEVYQDLFDEGSFSGKGLLHVCALHAVLASRLPEGQVLSHDLLEGCLTRCGSVGDVTLIEAAPSHADVAASRHHRWTRGDWQLLPLLRPRARLGLSALDRWKLLDNLRRSLVAPLSLVLLLLALATSAVLPWAALALALAAFGAGPLTGAIAGLAPSRDDLALRHFARHALAELGLALLGLLWHLALWLRQAMLVGDAIARACWRSGVSHRGLLQWTTAAAAEAAAKQGLSALLRHHGRLVLGAVGLALVLLVLGTSAPGLTLMLCGLWAGTPLWVAWASRLPTSPKPLAADDRAYLLSVAHDTWAWFERNVNASTHHLPPDNVQTVPRTMVAQRTSPTNIGLYLLSLACARAFSWVSAAQMADRLAATLDTLDLLPRERGHFLNWIDTQTLQTLAPAYVSTVDSGNLCGHLLAVAAACDEAGDDPATQASLSALAQRCRSLAAAADFAFLFDARRRLLHIGWRVADQQLDEGHYDLLASEARLASLWAIAKGDVPASHWAALGRPFQAAGPEVGLRSWSGSMFEYLMPSLVLDEPVGSVLDRACHMAVQEQRAYGRHLGLPWGVSESAYARADRTLAYQYAPQGVPRLALRRTPDDERVVAPYASALAAMQTPRAAVANLRWLQELGARTFGGFIEALDYTRSRQSGGEGGSQGGGDGEPAALPPARAFMPVHTGMSHHQGMSLVALTQVLLPGLPRRWGMADARIAAVANLLQERVPREVARLREPEVAMARGESTGKAEHAPRRVDPGAQAVQRTLMMSNGCYSVTLRANGAGVSRFEGIDINRGRDDALRDAHGSFFYLRRPGRPTPVSLSQHPAPDDAAEYAAHFHADRVSLHARWPDLRSRVTVWVSPEDDAEVRRVELWNTSPLPIILELLSAFEVCLSEARADETHPAFANLFVSADWDAEHRALHLVRKPRRENERALHAVHFVAHLDPGAEGVRVCTDRALWRGRLREVWQPLAQFDDLASPSGPCITGLDPVAALALRLTLPPHGTANLSFVTAASHDRDQLQALVTRFGREAEIERAAELSATLAALRLRDQRLSPDELLAVQIVTTLLVMLHTRPAPPQSDQLPSPVLDRRLLWRLGISGDRPLIVVNISNMQGLRLVRALVHGLLRWAWGGVLCDLVLINAEPPSYLQPLQHELQALRDFHAAESVVPARAGGLWVLPLADVTTAERGTLALLARLRLNADGRSLAQQVTELLAWHDAALAQRDGEAQAVRGEARPPPAGGPEAGRFDPAGGRYRFEVSPQRPTPRPWVNVLANPGFGSLVSESGAGCTWAGNSRLNQLTPWSNDVLADNDGESFWVQDLRNNAVWSVGAGAACRVEHGPGVTELRMLRGDIGLSTRWTVDDAQAIKRVRVTLHNQGGRVAKLRVMGLIEWMMGAVRVDRQSVQTGFASLPAEPEALRLDLLLATQRDDPDGLVGHTTFVALCVTGADGVTKAALHDWTCDRRELYDSRGRPVLPDQMGQRAGAGLDPCAALAAVLELAPGEQASCSFVMGHGASLAAALALARAGVATEPELDPDAAARRWQSRLGAITVATPDPMFDALVNHWLLLQTTACRLWGRAGFYQAGGAYGFRDQLQDAMALAITAPQLLRDHLLRAAARQFVEGDVQHWWHPHNGAGVRTRFSDDLLWLPHAVLHYVAATDDHAVYDETVPFIEGEPVPHEAEDLYSVPRLSAQQATLYEHCARTLDRSLAVGEHGLPLMGGGDWNDGMNAVGRDGRGESVWLGWFLWRVVADFVPVAQHRGEIARAARWQAAAAGWQAALQGPAWDGAWYRRAFFDDGTPLGSAANPECRIDLIAQAWSVLSGAAPLDRQQQAMAAAESLLVDPAAGLLRLLDPPLAHATPSAGYIQAYPPGVRENGGQYNHAVTWAVMAFAQLGQADAAWRSWIAMSPAHRSADPSQGPAYGLEPYAVAADVYSQPPYVGRGGWSWYTASAAGLYRAAVASILGLEVQGQRVRVRPMLPSHWPSAQITLRRGGGEHCFTLCAAGAASDIATALAQGARRLGVGEWLTLPPAGSPSHHLVVCLAGSASPLVFHPEAAGQEAGPDRGRMEASQGQGERAMGQADR